MSSGERQASTEAPEKRKKESTSSVNSQNEQTRAKSQHSTIRRRENAWSGPRTPQSATMSSSLASALPLPLPLLLVLFCVSTSARDFGSGSSTPGGGRHLEKRSLLTFPPDSIMQITMGVTVAGRLERNSGVIVLAFQQNAPLPGESQPLLAPSLVVAGRQFSVYRHLEEVMASYGFNGAKCLRKMICQIAETPLARGLLEDLVTFALTPSGHRGFQNATEEEWSSFAESETLGRLGGNCSSAFPECVQTPLDMVSSLIRV